MMRRIWHLALAAVGVIAFVGHAGAQPITAPGRAVLTRCALEALSVSLKLDTAQAEVFRSTVQRFMDSTSKPRSRAGYVKYDASLDSILLSALRTNSDSEQLRRNRTGFRNFTLACERRPSARPPLLESIRDSALRSELSPSLRSG